MLHSKYQIGGGWTAGRRSKPISLTRDWLQSQLLPFGVASPQAEPKAGDSDGCCREGGTSVLPLSCRAGLEAFLLGLLNGFKLFCRMFIVLCFAVFN